MISLSLLVNRLSGHGERVACARIREGAVFALLALVRLWALNDLHGVFDRLDGLFRAGTQGVNGRLKADRGDAVRLLAKASVHGSPDSLNDHTKSGQDPGQARSSALFVLAAQRPSLCETNPHESE